VDFGKHNLPKTRRFAYIEGYMRSGVNIGSKLEFKYTYVKALFVPVLKGDPARGSSG